MNPFKHIRQLLESLLRKYPELKELNFENKRAVDLFLAERDLTDHNIYSEASIDNAEELQTIYKKWAEKQSLLLSKYFDNEEIIDISDIKIRIKGLAKDNNKLIVTIFKGISEDLEQEISVFGVNNIKASMLSYLINSNITIYTSEDQKSFFKEMFKSSKEEFKKACHDFYNDLKVLNVNILFQKGIVLHQKAVLEQQRKEAEQMAIKHKEIAAMNNQAEATIEAANINAQAILQSGEIIAKSNDGIAQATSESGKTIAKSNEKIAQATIDSGKTIAGAIDKDNNPKPKFKGETRKYLIFDDSKSNEYILEFDFIEFDYVYNNKKYTGLKINQVYLKVNHCPIGSSNKVKYEVIKNDKSRETITNGDAGYVMCKSVEDIEIKISGDVVNSNANSITDPTEEKTIGGRVMVHGSVEGNIGVVKAQGGVEVEGHLSYTTKDAVINNTTQMGYEGNRILTIILRPEIHSNSKQNKLMVENIYIPNIKGTITPNNILLSLKYQKV